MATYTDITRALERGRYLPVVKSVDPHLVANHWFSVVQAPEICKIWHELREVLLARMGYVPADVLAYHDGDLVLPLIPSSPDREIVDDDHFYELMRQVRDALQIRASEIAGESLSDQAEKVTKLTDSATTTTSKLAHKQVENAIGQLVVAAKWGAKIEFPIGPRKFEAIKLPSEEAMRCSAPLEDNPPTELSGQVTGFDVSLKAVIVDGNKFLFGLPDPCPGKYPVGTTLWVNGVRGKNRTWQMWDSCEVTHAPKDLLGPGNELN